MFQSLRINQQFYILTKGVNPRLDVGTVMTVTAPQIKFPAVPQGLQPEYVVDVTVTVNGATQQFQRLPANKEIDELTEQEYQYWVNEAKKCGSAKSKYELKRTYLTRAKSLAFRHQNHLDSQIKWLDEQLAKKNRKRH